MPTFIKTGFWEKARKGYKEWLNLDQFIESKIPVPTYKVFTAFLTQSGGDNSNVFVSSGLLTIGVTYTIDEIISGNPDWTNVGAPNNEVGTKFIATGTTPNSWGEDATLYYSDAAPVATVLENTIGNIFFEYIDIGAYSIGSNNLFTGAKTSVIMATPYDQGDPLTPRTYTTRYQQENLIDLYTLSLAPSPSDNSLNGTFIEIRVYN